MLYFALITLLIAKEPVNYWSRCSNRLFSFTITSISVKENSPGLNPVDYRIWGRMQQRLYKTPVRGTIDLKKHLVDNGPASRSASSTKPLTSGQHGYAHA